MEIKEFDVFVIGTGSAGKTVAEACVEAGKKVAIADHREFGGTCANRGCDPKKVLVGLSEIMDRTEKMKGKGITQMPEFSWQDIQNFKKKFVDAVPAATEKDLKSLGIEMYHQSPQFLDENTLSVEGKTIKAQKIVIATGQKPMELRIPGRDFALVSDDFLELAELPESMIFIGAGYIGMELAHIAARLGVKVTILDMADRPLSNFNEKIVNPLTKISEDIGIDFIFNAGVSEIEKLQKNFRVNYQKDDIEESIKAEMVFNTAGRVPSINHLNLEKGNVSFTSKGVTVNKYLQNPGNKNVYACGDVSASEGLPLTPLSSIEAKIVITHILDKNIKEKAKYPAQPSVVFTTPQLASIGLSVEEAERRNFDINVKENFGLNWFNAKRINERTYGFQTIIDKKSGQILGAHIIASEAAEMINLFAMAMQTQLTYKEVKALIFAYPTWGNDIKQMI